MMNQVERHVITMNHKYYKELDRLCFLSKNLYNSTLYAVRQYYFKNKGKGEKGGYLNYNAVNKQFTVEKQADYIALPRKVSKWTQKLVDADMRSFFALLKAKQKGKYTKEVRIPKYADKVHGRKPLHYERGALSFQKEGYIRLSQTEVYIKTKIGKEDVKYVKVIPSYGHIEVMVGYEREEKEVKEGEVYAAIDIGVNNLAAVTYNKYAPYIINGRPLKSINQYYNKKRAEYQSKLGDGVYTTKRLRKLASKRKNKIVDYLHKASTLIVNQLVSKGVSLLVIGHSKGWKQDTKMWKKDNQNFVSIPFNCFIAMLKYKCRLKGIRVEEQEESYTSKCSFMDREEIRKHESYLGRRVKRGLYKTLEGRMINADINGSLNIMKKYLEGNEAWDNQKWLDCVEASSVPNIIRVSV